METKVQTKEAGAAEAEGTEAAAWMAFDARKWLGHRAAPPFPPSDAPPGKAPARSPILARRRLVEAWLDGGATRQG